MKKKSLDSLKAELEALQAEVKKRQAEESAKLRKFRNHRLIQLGAELELILKDVDKDFKVEQSLSKEEDYKYFVSRIQSIYKMGLILEIFLDGHSIKVSEMSKESLDVFLETLGTKLILKESKK